MITGEGTARVVADAIGAWHAQQRTQRPARRPVTMTVALDGPGASGKSTIAAAAAGMTGAALVRTDDFFRWPEGTGPHPMERYYDWRRIAQALARARAGALAGGAGTVILEGVFSSAPQLSSLVDRTVLVDTPEHERIQRLRGRLTQEEWSEDWLAAERRYFTEVRPPASFGLVVSGRNP